MCRKGLGRSGRGGHYAGSVRRVITIGSTVLDTLKAPSAFADLARKHETMLKYGVIGASAVAVDVGLFVILHELFDVAAWAAHSASVGLAVVWSFLLNAFFNFRTTDRLLVRFVSFATVAFVGYLIGLAIIGAGMGWFDLGGTVAKLISMPVVFGTQYLLNSRISFRSST